MVRQMLVDTIEMVASGELKPRQGRPWVMYLLPHGANSFKSVNSYNKLKDFVRNEVSKLAGAGELKWLDCGLNLEAGKGWADFHGCYVIYIWPRDETKVQQDIAFSI